jgi:hypothetical protein
MKPYSLLPDQGEAIWMFDSLDTIKADADHTGGGFAVAEFLDLEGSSVPLHVNDGWDRGFYILEGGTRSSLSRTPWRRIWGRGSSCRAEIHMRGGAIRRRDASSA